MVNEPKMRAVWASGASDWLIARLANGTPPNGQFQRTSAATTKAAGSAIRRPVVEGTAAATAP